MSGNKQLALNTLATAINLIVAFSISFFLTSYLVKTIGSTAYGFFGLANTIVNYALIITTALNSMAARFIGIEVHKGDFKQASVYYSSVFVADSIFAALIFIPSCIAIWYINYIFDVPSDLLSDVRILFYVVFLNMCLNIISAVFGGVYVIKNRLDLSSYITIISHILKALLLVYLYWKFEPSIIYLGTATLLATLITITSNIHFNRKLLPEVKLSKGLSSWHAVKTIVSSGVWNSLNQLSVTLLHGLDLLLANLFISSAAMGVLSVSGTIPGVITSCLFSLANVYTPVFLEHYAHGKFDKLLNDLKNSIKLMTIVTCIPIGSLIGFGMPFYKLWVPNVDLNLLYGLSIFVVLPLFSGGAISGTNYIYTITNKVKWQSIVLLLTGLINVFVVFILLKTTSLGVYAIVGVSATIGIIRNFIFNAPYAAYCIKQPLRTLYPEMIISIVCLVVWASVGLLLSNYLSLDSWGKLIGVGFSYIIILTYITTYILLSKSQRNYLLKRIRGIINRH